MTVNKMVKCTLYGGMVLALLATLVTFASVQANIVCTVSVALTISNVSAMKISRNHATICWSTDGKATSQVFYDTVSHDSVAEYAYYTVEKKALVEEHKATLNKLFPSATYYYRVRSTAGGIEFVSDEYLFVTLTSRGGWSAWLADLFLEFTSPFYLSWSW